MFETQSHVYLAKWQYGQSFCLLQFPTITTAITHIIITASLNFSLLANTTCPQHHQGHYRAHIS